MGCIIVAGICAVRSGGEAGDGEVTAVADVDTGRIAADLLVLVKVSEILAVTTVG